MPEKKSETNGASTHKRITEPASKPTPWERPLRQVQDRL
jgi:hypothetical protein